MSYYYLPSGKNANPLKALGTLVKTILWAALLGLIGLVLKLMFTPYKHS